MQNNGGDSAKQEAGGVRRGLQQGWSWLGVSHMEVPVAESGAWDGSGMAQTHAGGSFSSFYWPP